MVTAESSRDILHAVRHARAPVWLLVLLLCASVLATAFGTFYYGIRSESRECYGPPDVTMLRKGQHQLEREAPLPSAPAEYNQAFERGLGVIRDHIRSVQEGTERNAVAQLGQLSQLAESIRLQNVSITKAAEEAKADQTAIRFRLDTLMLYNDNGTASETGGERADPAPTRPGMTLRIPGEHARADSVSVPSTPRTDFSGVF